MIRSLKRGYILAGDEMAGALQLVLRLSRERDAPRQVLRLGPAGEEHSGADNCYRQAGTAECVAGPAQRGLGPWSATGAGAILTGTRRKGFFSFVFRSPPKFPFCRT